MFQGLRVLENYLDWTGLVKPIMWTSERMTFLKFTLRFPYWELPVRARVRSHIRVCTQYTVVSAVRYGVSTVFV